ncbi:rRNA maturation RNase YbeY [Parasphingopyxis marina]|uniref:Endoribonuclease YbeY n=1 Tax=Parasphingopyxis marina TaxID=2761622 RepID=A0A842I412_9SPHN|nr:rRNA maturation RNase YbeY [Parasphingopyxis marina]MBC2778844.1 rRNA maturation RNase YbeY [Parasphingopyxis marina]
MIETAVQIGAQWDTDIDWAALALAATTQAIRQTPHAGLISDPMTVEISVKFTDDEEVRKLNASYRAKDKPTNVLSFPMVQSDMIDALANSDDGEVLLGDIVLAHGVCAREAEDKGIAVRDHAAHLVVHGALHLLGYDHEKGEAEAEAMEAMERTALAILGIADPYKPAIEPDEV